jgi:DNA-directed RNA polymerase subunit M/transcription elongation factor TFIIS
MKFCTRDGCDNILNSLIKNNKLIFQCDICYEIYESNDIDTLMIEEYTQETSSLYKYQIYLKNAHDDTISELIKKKCINPKCKENIVRVIKVDPNGQSIYICPTCKTKYNSNIDT